MAGGKPIAKNSLYNLLTNMIYLGKVEYGGQVYEGEHERIIDDETWNQVQTTLNRNGRRGGRNIGNKYGALLKGLVRCGTCDVGMIHTYVSKKDRLYRYYVCVKAHQRGWAQCETRSVSAPGPGERRGGATPWHRRAIPRCCARCYGSSTNIDSRDASEDRKGEGGHCNGS